MDPVTSQNARAGSRTIEGPALELHGITKSFGHVHANRDVTFDVGRGEILGLLGENGAGKSTLMNIVYGLYQPDGGEIRVGGVASKISSPVRAVDLGIGMVHQHFMLVPDMTVAENVALAPSLTPGVSRLGTVSRRLTELGAEYGLDIDPAAVIEDLPLGVRQRVEIVKLLYRGADILILDEPTAALSDDEWLQLAEFLKGLRDGGKSIVFITHKLDELFGVAERCTVLRHGEVVGTVAMSETDKAGLARMMVGREVVLERPRITAELGAPVVRVEGLTVSDADGRRLLDDISLEVRAGEILGIAGVGANGQDELAEVLVGVRPVDEGRIHIGDRDCTGFSAADFGRLGGALIPADRHADGMALDLSLLENLIARDLELSRFVKRGVLDRAAAREHCERLRSEYDIRCSNIDAPMRELSGGNQQKAVFARELSRQVRFLVAAEPTRGLDVGAAEFVYTKLNERKSAGAGILLISSELDEVMSLSDRIAVMVDGVMSEPRKAATETRESIGLLMAGEGIRKAVR